MNKFNLNLLQSSYFKFFENKITQIRTIIYQLGNAMNTIINVNSCTLKEYTLITSQIQLSNVIKVRTNYNFLWLFFSLLEQVIPSTKNYDIIFNLYDKKHFFFFGFPLKISFSSLYIKIESWIYIFNSVYVLNDYVVQYFKIFIMFVLIFLITNVMFGVPYFFSFTAIKEKEKLGQYECGFQPFDEATRYPFDIQFYVVGILFLIFDVEIALLFPWVYTLHLLTWLGFYVMMLFLIILTVGFFYEWHRGALAWSHMNLLVTKKLI